ncbi:MAG: hypothetical protein KGM47_04625 [Acidobacteriota bacterium]|nr:hypothetical protein [Acidobacteriota bacterium]
MVFTIDIGFPNVLEADVYIYVSHWTFGEENTDFAERSDNLIERMPELAQGISPISRADVSSQTDCSSRGVTAAKMEVLHGRLPS